MNARFFLDTNVFVYSFDARAPAKSTRATQLIRQAVNTRQGIVSFQVIQEFFNVVLQRFTEPITVEDAERYLATVFRPLLAVQSSQILYAEGLHLRDRYHLSWYDSLIVAAAIEGKCRTLYSEDFHHGQRFGDLQIENPFL